MRNVSFDNPYLFLLAIPLVLLIVIPFIIAIRKENRQKSTVISLVIHFVIVTLVTFAAAGTLITEIKTETTVYVVADVSYSSDKNLDLIDDYIEDIKKDLPRNTKLGVICFGTNEPQVLYMPGEESKSVKEAKVDNFASDISSALLFASSDELFPRENLKRIVLITDAKDTVGGTQGSLVSAVQVLEKKDIKLDAIFLDNNLKDSDLEIQLSDLQGTKKTFSTVESELRLILQANYENNDVNGKTKLEVYQKLHNEDDSEYKLLDAGKEFSDVEFLAGFNVKTIKLPKRAEGVYDYKVVLTPVEGGDYTLENNIYTFTQEVSNDINMLVLAGSKDELISLKGVYGDIANVDPYIVDVDKKGQARVRLLLDDGSLQTEKTVPYTIETLSKYDEIVISNVDVRNIPNTTSFLHYLETVVELFGKNLTTMGNLEIQNKTDNFLKDLEGMLPVTYGNANADKKLYTFVLDASHSVNQAYKFRAVKEIAKNVLTLLNDNDYVAIVSFSGEVKVKLDATELGPNREKIIEAIDSLELKQGTMLGTALNTAYEVVDAFDAGESQIMLITDGKATPHDPNKPKDVAIKMKAKGITVDTINVSTQLEDAIQLLKNIASITGGNYKMVENTENVEDFVFSEIADDLTNSIVETESSVHVKIPDPILNGIAIEPPPIYGYMQTSVNPDSTLYLTVDYVRDSDGYVARVPLYAVRNHGNGTVATFTSSMAGEWLKGWDDSFKKTFFENMVNSNLPNEKIDYPYTVSIEKIENVARVTVTPADIRQDAKATIYYKLAGTEDEYTVREMSFDSQKYTYTIDLLREGKYSEPKSSVFDIKVIYEYEESPGYLIDIHGEDSSDVVANLLMKNGDVVAVLVGNNEYPLERVHSRNNIGISGKYHGLNENGERIFEINIDIKSSNITFRYSGGDATENVDTWSYTMHKGNISTTYIEVPYLSEYDAFTAFTPSVLHASVNGQVVNGSGLKIEIDEDEIEIYEKPLDIYLLIAAMVLFIIDVAVRVIKIKKKKGAKR